MNRLKNQEKIPDNRPLADRMRPRTLGEYMGQPHLLGENSLLRRAIEDDRLFSMIFWGPPGSGKTTLARVIACETKSYFASFSAVLSGVKEIRMVIDEAGSGGIIKKRRSFLLMRFTGLTRPSKMPSCHIWRMA